MDILYWEVSLWRGFDLVYRATFLTESEANRDAFRLMWYGGHSRKDVSVLGVSAL